MEYKDFLYHIDELTNVIYFNPMRAWESEGCLADSYTDEEDTFIEEVAKDLELIGAVESGYEPIKRKKVAGFESKLLSLGFIYDEKFSKFMKSCLGEMTEDDLIEDDYSEEPEELNFDT
jgi:hypothetical protein